MPTNNLKTKNLIPIELFSMMEQNAPEVVAKVNMYIDSHGYFHEVYIRDISFGIIGEPDKVRNYGFGVFGHDIMEDRAEYSQEFLGWINFPISRSLMDAVNETALLIPCPHPWIVRDAINNVGQ